MSSGSPRHTPPRARNAQSTPAGERRASRRIMAAPGDIAAQQIGPKSAHIILAFISALTLVLGTVGYATIGRLNGNLAQAGDLSLGGSQDGAIDILLAGVDSRTDAQGKPLTQRELDMLRAGEEDVTNTDTLILIRIPNDGSGATAVSVPRDTYVSTPDMGNMKINGVYGVAKFEEQERLYEQHTADGTELTPEDKRHYDEQAKEAGREALISSVADLTGISVDHYAEVGLLGFVLLTDAVGGVDVCLKDDVKDHFSGANFKAGRSTLKGADALSFVRQRHGLPRGDLDRITRQQAYMASLVSKVLSSSTLTDPGSLNKINTAVQRSVVLDNNWDVMGLASQMQNLAGGNVKFETIPVTSIDGTGDYGESIVTVDKNQIHEFFNNMLGEEDRDDAESGEDSGKKIDPDAPIEDYAAGDYTVNVFNASQTPGLAAGVAELATGYGYREGDVGNSEETGVSESQVNAKDKNDPAARGLARQLGGLKVVEDSSLSDRQLSVTLSGTYTGPGSYLGALPLKKPNDPFVGTHSEGMRDLDGDGIPDDQSYNADGTLAGSGSTESDVVGTPGSMDAEGNVVEGGAPEAKKPTESIDAGGDGIRCVN